MRSHAGNSSSCLHYRSSPCSVLDTRSGSDPQFAAGDRLSNTRCALSGATSSHQGYGSSGPGLVSLMQPLCPGADYPWLPSRPLSLAGRGPSYIGLFVVYPNSKRPGRRSWPNSPAGAVSRNVRVFMGRRKCTHSSPIYRPVRSHPRFAVDGAGCDGSRFRYDHALA